MLTIMSKSVIFYAFVEFSIHTAHKNDTNMEKRNEKTLYLFFFMKMVGTFCGTCTATGYPCL